MDGTHFRRQAPIDSYIVDFFFWNSEITRDLTAVLERIYVELYGSRAAEVELLKHLRRR